MTRAETRELAAVLRRLLTPQEQHRESQVEHTVRHRSLARCRHSPGSTAAAVEPDAPGARAVRPADARPAPDPTWLLRAGLATVADDSATALVAEGLEGINSALAAMEARAKGRFEAETEPETESAEEASIDRVTRRKVVDALLASLCAPGAGQRTDKSQAALRLLTRHAHLLARPPGLMDRASPFFHALLRCRTSSNKTIRTLAVPALDEFFRAMTDALSDDGAAPAAEREAIWSQISGEVMRLMDSKEAKAKERTTALRAMGKLARRGGHRITGVGGFGCDDGAGGQVDDGGRVPGRGERLRQAFRGDGASGGDAQHVRGPHLAATPGETRGAVHAGRAGGHRAMGLGALSHCRRSHADAAARVPARSESRASRARRSHSARRVDVQGDAAADGAHPSRRAAGSYRFRALSRAARPLMAQARVSLWVHLLGGDGFAVPGAPDAGENVSTKRNKRGSVSEAVTAAAAAARRRSRSLTLEASGSDRSGLDAPRSRVRVGSDPLGASDGGVRRLRGRGSPAVPHPATRRGSRARPPTAEEAEESARNPSGTSAAEDRGRVPDGSDGSEAMRDALALELGDGVAAADPGDMQTFLCLVDLACAVISAAPAAHVARWLSTLIENLSALSGAHPLLSGFYKIARTRSSPQSAPADAIDHAARCTCRAFLRDVLAGVERQTDELRASALQLLLAAPPGILAPREIDARPRRARHRSASHSARRGGARRPRTSDHPPRDGRSSRSGDGGVPTLLSSPRCDRTSIDGPPAETRVSTRAPAQTRSRRGIVGRRRSLSPRASPRDARTPQNSRLRTALWVARA